MTISIIIIGVICFLFGFLISICIKTIKIKEKNQEIEKEENQAQLRIKELEKEYFQKQVELDNEYHEIINKYNIDYEKQNLQLKEITSKIDEKKQAWEQEKTNKILTWTQQESNLKSEVSGLEHQINEKKKFIDDLDEQAKTAVKLVEEQVIDNMTNTVEQQSKKLYSTYKDLEDELKTDYINLTNELYNNFQEQDEKLNNLILTKKNELNELQSKATAAVEANKRIELERQEKNFYRLQLSDIDLEEIKRIKSIEPYLRKKEPLNKVIWKVYYEKPYTDLIGRIIGQGRKTGIYKITNIENGMCYVGQAVKLAGEKLFPVAAGGLRLPNFIIIIMKIFVKSQANEEEILNNFNLVGNFV